MRMSNRSRLGLAVLLVGAVGGGSRAEAQDMKFDFCRTAKPNAAVTLGTNGPVTSTTTTGSYFTSSCYRYVVDVKAGMPASNFAWLVGVTAGAAALPGAKKNAAGFAIPATKSDCDSYSQLTSFYKKGAAESEFKKVSAVSTNGAWNGTACVVTPPKWSDQNQTLNATYRIAVGVKMANTWRGVSGRGSATQLPN